VLPLLVHRHFRAVLVAAVDRHHHLQVGLERPGKDKRVVILREHQGGIQAQVAAGQVQVLGQGRALLPQHLRVVAAGQELLHQLLEVL
jgi:hypothetical protein